MYICLVYKKKVMPFIGMLHTNFPVSLQLQWTEAFLMSYWQPPCKQTWLKTVFILFYSNLFYFILFYFIFLLLLFFLFYFTLFFSSIWFVFCVRSSFIWHLNDVGGVQIILFLYAFHCLAKMHRGVVWNWKMFIEAVSTVYTWKCKWFNA